MTSDDCDSAWLWITDPWATLDHARDTTLRLIEEAQRLGVCSFWADVRSVTWMQGRVEVDAFAITAVGGARTTNDFVLTPRGRRRPSAFASVHYRPDPPMDLSYLHPLQLIASDIETKALSGGACELVNPASVLLTRSEKVLDGAPALMPPTLVASAWDALVDFGRSEGTTIVKPLHQAQSKDVALLDWQSPDAADRHRALLASLTDNFVRPVVMQRYLEAVRRGETRLWFVDGDLLACARKLPAAGTYKIDMDKGGSLVAHDPTGREQEVIPVLRSLLLARRIRLAAVDLIDGFVTDFNFSSPGLLVQMETVLGANLARRVVLGLQHGPLALSTPTLTNLGLAKAATSAGN